MNVLIVDDEPIIRVGLKSLVDWERNGFHLIGEAADGVEALELFRSRPVDIVITDIRMPRMDGLALMREVKSVQDDVGLLVLSCLDDFAYVKEAMKLGAQDYILKPTMEPEELLSILQTVKEKLGEKRQTKRALAEWREHMQQSGAYKIADSLRQFVESGNGQERLETELFSPGCGLFSVWVEGDLSALPNIEERTLPGAKAVVRWSERIWIALYAYEKSASEKERYERMFASAQSLYSRCKENASKEADWFVCLGPAITRLPQIHESIAVHRKQAHNRFYGAPNAFITSWPESVADGPLPVAERNDFLRAVSNGNPEAAYHSIDMLTESVRRHQPGVPKLQSFLLETLGVAFGLARQHHPNGAEEDDAVAGLLQPLRSALHVEPLCAFVKETARKLWMKPLGHEAAKGAGNPFIRKAIRFMREQYNRNIGTVDIADHVKLSRSYLSDLFSKEMGESLTETLTRIRIEEAKRKLRSGEMKVYEVAEAVGFSDSKSFAKTFKRLVGCTPKEYESSSH
ncbi:response regulator [Paenibacillus ginsengarvi]|uniref:Response regulator n=1 Tax=Paenibacillus ginsengarvi TaxID=400777 RepID=A0A3B0CQ23_9BACL|nr:response regulator [Paenibacillus ginsengarvi]RKN86581.1 response regulator [Paenibacillus ginsengarvi]